MVCKLISCPIPNAAARCSVVRAQITRVSRTSLVSLPLAAWLNDHLVHRVHGSQDKDQTLSLQGLPHLGLFTYFPLLSSSCSQACRWCLLYPLLALGFFPQCVCGPRLRVRLSPCVSRNLICTLWKALLRSCLLWHLGSPTLEVLCSGVCLDFPALQMLLFCFLIRSGAFSHKLLKLDITLNLSEAPSNAWYNAGLDSSFNLNREGLIESCNLVVFWMEEEPHKYYVNSLLGLILH